MANKSIPETTNPAVLRYRGQNLEAMTAMQMRSLDAMRRMVNLMLDSTQSITERQTEFFKSSVDLMNATHEKNDEAADPQEIFKRQTVAYQDLYDSLSDHVAELAKVTSKCCAKMANEAVEVIGEQPDSSGQKSCCCTQAGGVDRKNGSAKK